MVRCIVLFTSAQIGKTVLLKRTVSVFFYLPQGCEEDKVLGKCCQQDRLVTTWEGWHYVRRICSYNEKYRTDWICRWLICPLLCQHAINLEKLQFFLKSSWQRLCQSQKSCRKKLLWTHSVIIGPESGMIVVCLRFFLSLDWQHGNFTFDIPPFLVVFI